MSFLQFFAFEKQSLDTRDAATTGRVELDENGLTGPLPVDLLRNPTAQRVRLHGNQFTGEIPTNVGQMSSLEDLVLSSNALRGTLPTELFRLPDLVQLAVDTCGMSGTLSEDFARWNRTMRNLILSNNKFTGPIPQAFDHLTTLSELHMGLVLRGAFRVYDFVANLFQTRCSCTAMP